MIPWWQKGLILHTITTHTNWAGCGNSPVPGSITEEQSFGAYSNLNSNHGCVSSATSTTNTWLGRYFS